MPSETPFSSQPSLPLKPSAEYSVEEMQRELRLLSTRMDGIEKRLGIQRQPVAPPEVPKPWSSGAPEETPVSAPQPAPPVAPAPIPDPFPEATEPSVPPPATPLPATPPIVPPSKPEPVTSAATSGISTASTQRNLTAVGTRANGATRAATDKNLLGDWENLIGGKWALWVGLFSLFLAIASFLAYTWQSLPPAPPAVRMALGIAAGVALIGAGSFFRTRTQRWFSESLTGAGLAVLYLAIWAGAQQYHLLSFGTAFTAMGLTTVVGVYLAIRFDALSLSILATLGGFLTPLLLHGNTASGGEIVQNQSLSLLAYVAVLNAGILAVSLFKRWNSLTWLSFIATVLLICAWAIDDYSVSQRWPAFAYFTLYFLLFVGASSFYSLARREQTAQPDLLMLFAATSVYALAGYAMLDDALGVVPGTFAFALALFFGFLCGAIKILAPDNFSLRQSAAGLALLFLTVAVPIQFQQQGLVIGWTVEAAVLLILGMRLNAPLLQRAGQVVWCLSMLPLLGVLLKDTPAPSYLFFNERALPLLLSVLATALVVIQHWATLKKGGTAQNTVPQPPLLDPLAPVYATYVVVAAAWLLAQETYVWFAWNPWPTAATWQAGALYTISGLMALFAVAAFAIGMKSRDIAVRVSAMAVLALAVTLPVWTGIAFFSDGWTPFWNLRWLSYIVVALALAAIGWMINHDRQVFTAGEAQTTELWPAAISLFALTGITIEVYCGFAHWALPDNLTWRAEAFFAIAMLWSVFAASMVYLAYIWRQKALRMTAITISGLGSLLLLLVSLGYSSLSWTPVFNLRALAFAVTVAFLGLIAVMENRRVGEEKDDESTFAASTSVALALFSTCLLLWGLTQESYVTFGHFQSTLGTHWKLIAFFFISVLWNIGMLALLFAGLRCNLISFRVAAYGLAVLSSMLLLWTAMDAVRLGWMPLLNARCAAFVLAALLLGASSALLAKYRDTLTDREQEGITILSWVAETLILWAITQEAYETCFYLREALGSYWMRWAQMTISLAWSVYGAVLLVAGINRNYQPLRLAALGLLSITVLKVFLFDLGFLSGPLRMYSLAGLGLALVFISWLYGRYAKSSATPVDATAE